MARIEPPQLHIELIPRGAWRQNLRTELSEETWKRLRNECYKKARYRCQICGGQGPKHPVECHEVWEWDEDEEIQILKGLIALCPDCHRVKHYGFAKSTGRGWEAYKHLKKVNRWSWEQTDQHIYQAYEDYHRRSYLSWTLDLSWLDENT